MDWWITFTDKANPVRFGVNNNYLGKHSTSGYVAAVGFDQQSIFYKPNDLAYFEYSNDVIRLNLECLEELEQIDFSNMDADREPFVGYWPKDYEQNQQHELRMNTQVISKDLNRILYGAAGTGKTYHTINHALSIIENKSLEVLEQEDRIALKQRFDEYKKQGQIKFVTFHQSFSYEDFVEGIRAETDDIGKLTYDVQYGVFKEICKRAVFKQVSEVDIDRTLDDFVEQISLNEKVLETKTGVEFTAFNSSGKGGDIC